jgi:putative ABC transport system substrate-binding protein
MAIEIPRREFVTGLGVATTLAWPLAAQPAMPVIGYLHSGSPGALEQEMAAFRQGLYETGYVKAKEIDCRPWWLI